MLLLMNYSKNGKFSKPMNTLNAGNVSVRAN
jgi:hypothetical protein